MQVRIGYAPWLRAAWQALRDLERLGYRITEEHIDRLIESAVIVEIV